MKRVSKVRVVSTLFLLIWINQVAHRAQAQPIPNEDECAKIQTSFVSAMSSFRTAYFQRRGAEGSAESVMEDRVIPMAEKMYEVCPENIAAVIRSGVENANASLHDPRRAQLVACDRALISYQEYLRRFDSQSLSSYADYRNLLYSEIDPAAEAAVNSCPQMPDLARQTRLEIIELQRRLDRMEDIDNQGPSYWETRDDMEEYNDAYDEAYGQ